MQCRTSGWIPSDCNGYASSHNVSASDFIIYQVQYSDCSDPWIMCYHKDSETSIENMAKQFGRIPIQMREWVSLYGSLTFTPAKHLGAKPHPLAPGFA